MMVSSPFRVLRRLNRRSTFTTPKVTYSELYATALEEPHFLVAGATRSGKSVFINGLFSVLLSKLPFDQPGGAQLILIDPKRVELVRYRNLPHCVFYASEPDRMVSALEYAMQIADDRFRRMQVRGIKKYDGSDVWVIIDEFADLMTTNRRVVQPLVQRLAQIGGAGRVHLILATQTPISKVLPTEIKCNFDARLGLRTRSAQDSRNIIGIAGLEDLPRHGKGYLMTPDIEGFCDIPLVEESQLDELVKFWENQL